MRIGFIFVLVVFVLSGFGENDQTGISGTANTNNFSFLKIGYEARAVGMAGASAAMPNDLYGVLSNPAALGYIPRMQAMISYNPYFLDLRGGTVSFARRQGSLGVWALNVVYLSEGSFVGRDESNQLTETYDPLRIAVNASWAKTFLESFSCGLTLRGIYERLSVANSVNSEVSASGFACDIGAQYRLKASRLIYGILMKNLGVVTSRTINSATDKRLPLIFSTGISYILKNIPNMRVAFDLEKPQNDYLLYRLGLELNIIRQIVFMRAGYNFSQYDLKQLFSFLQNSNSGNTYQKTNWTLFTLGLGINTKVSTYTVAVDCALHFRTDRMNPNFILSMLLGF
jgi:hypothetical protein